MLVFSTSAPSKLLQVHQKCFTYFFILFKCSSYLVRCVRQCSFQLQKTFSLCRHITFLPCDALYKIFPCIKESFLSAASVFSCLATPSLVRTDAVWCVEVSRGANLISEQVECRRGSTLLVLQDDFIFPR